MTAPEDQGSVRVHITMVVLRGDRVQRVEHALLEEPAAGRVLAGWGLTAGGPARAAGLPGSRRWGPGARTGSRSRWWAGRRQAYLVLAGVCVLAGATFWALAP